MEYETNQMGSRKSKVNRIQAPYVILKYFYYFLAILK